MEKKDNLIEFGQIMSDLFKGQKKILGEVEKLILAKYGEGNNVGVRNSLEDGRNYLRLNYAKDRGIASVNVVDGELQFNIISGKTREAVCLDRFIRNYGIVEAVRVITSLLWTVNDDYVKIDGDSHNGTATEVWNSTDIVLYYFNGHEVIEVFDIDSIDEVPEGYYCILKEDEPKLDLHMSEVNNRKLYRFKVYMTVTGEYEVMGTSPQQAREALYHELPKPEDAKGIGWTAGRLQGAVVTEYDPLLLEEGDC